jgi:hypothetical protein
VGGQGSRASGIAVRRRYAHRETARGSCSVGSAPPKGCVCATDARRAGAPGVPLDDADHRHRRRRDESPRPVSGCAARRCAPHRVGRRRRSLETWRKGAGESATVSHQRRVSRSPRPRTGVTPEAVKRARSVTAAQVTDLRGSQKTMRRAQLFHDTSAGARTRYSVLVLRCRIVPRGGAASLHQDRCVRRSSAARR